MSVLVARYTNFSLQSVLTLSILPLPVRGNRRCLKNTFTINKSSAYFGRSTANILNNGDCV